MPEVVGESAAECRIVLRAMDAFPHSVDHCSPMGLGVVDGFGPAIGCCSG